MADKRELLLAAAKTALEGLLYSASDAETLDSYPTNNHAGGASILRDPVNGDAKAQSFQFDSDALITAVTWYMQAVGTPPGTIVAKIYAASGTHGTNALPTGVALATSDVVTAALGSGYALVEFSFSTPLFVDAGTTYCVAVEYGAGDLSNWIDVAVDQSSPTHEGNPSGRATNGTWTVSGDAPIFILTGTDGVAGPTGLRVTRHLARQADIDRVPDISVLYLGEELIDSATGEVDRNIRVGLRCRARADASESGDAGLIPVLSWAELALMSDYTLGGIAANGRLERIDAIDTAEHADMWAEALMQFLFTIQTKWGDPTRAP